MKQYQTSIAILFGAFLLYQCTTKDEGTTIFINKVATSAEITDDSVRISHQPILDHEYLLRSKFDSVASLTVQLEISQPMLASIHIGTNYAPIFLRPNDHLIVTLQDSLLSFKSVSESSTLGALNNHLNQMYYTLNTYTNMRLGRNPDDFFSGLDSTINKINEQAKILQDSIPFKPNEIEVFNKLFKLKIEESKIYYAFMYHNNKLVEQIYALREGRPAEDYVAPPSLTKLINEITIDSTLLNSPIYGSSYKYLLNLYNREKFNSQIFDYNKWDNPDPYNPLKVADLIRAEKLPESIAEFLQALSVAGYSREEGITKVTDSLYRNFETEFPNSIYSQHLSKVFIKQGLLSQGKTAPNIKGSKIDGTIANLTDFKGRIVYVDVWATWCAPCVEEIPHSIKLQEFFKDDPSIIFLNISVDGNAETWKHKVALEKDWGGVHINLNKVQKDSLSVNYQLTGYPTYILIDKDGKIVTTRAQRPSSGEELKAELEKLSKTRTSL